MEKLKVYEFLKCDLVVTNLSKEDTHKWYEDYTGEDVIIDSIEETDLNTIVEMETIEGKYEPVTIGEYIKDISTTSMPLVIASREY